MREDSHDNNMKSRVKTYILAAIITITSSPLSQSCSCDSNVTPAAKTSTRIKDREAYELGALHASRLLENAENEDMVQDALLDVRVDSLTSSDSTATHSPESYFNHFSPSRICSTERRFITLLCSKLLKACNSTAPTDNVGWLRSRKPS